MIPRLLKQSLERNELFARNLRSPGGVQPSIKPRR